MAYLCSKGITRTLKLIRESAVRAVLKAIRTYGDPTLATKELDDYIQEALLISLEDSFQNAIEEAESIIEEIEDDARDAGFDSGYAEGTRDGRADTIRDGFEDVRSANSSAAEGDAIIVVSDDVPEPLRCPHCHASLELLGTEIVCTKGRHVWKLSSA